MAGEAFQILATNAGPSATEAVLRERVRSALSDVGFNVDLIFREG